MYFSVVHRVADIPTSLSFGRLVKCTRFSDVYLLPLKGRTRFAPGFERNIVSKYIAAVLFSSRTAKKHYIEKENNKHLIYSAGCANCTRTRLSARPSPITFIAHIRSMRCRAAYCFFSIYKQILFGHFPPTPATTAVREHCLCITQASP